MNILLTLAILSMIGIVLAGVLQDSFPHVAAVILGIGVSVCLGIVNFIVIMRICTMLK